MSLVTLRDLRTSLQNAKDECEFFDWANTKMWLFVVIGWIFNILFLLPYAYYQKQTALNDLADKIGCQALDPTDPAIAKVVLQARKLLKSQGFEFFKLNNTELRAELSKTLMPVFLKAFGKSVLDEEFAEQYYLWLIWACSEGDPLGFVSEENGKYTSRNICDDLNAKLEAFTEFYSLSLGDLKEIICDDLSLDSETLKESLISHLRQVLSPIFGNLLPKEYLSTFLELALAWAGPDPENFEQFPEVIDMLEPGFDKNLPDILVKTLKSHKGLINQLKNKLKNIQELYLLTHEELIKLVESAFNFSVGQSPFLLMITRPVMLKQEFDSFLSQHPELRKQKKILFNCAVSYTSWDGFPKALKVLGLMMEKFPDEMAKMSQDLFQFSEKFRNWLATNPNAAAVLKEAGEQSKKAESDVAIVEN